MAVVEFHNLSEMSICDRKYTRTEGREPFTVRYIDFYDPDGEKLLTVRAFVQDEYVKTTHTVWDEATATVRKEEV